MESLSDQARCELDFLYKNEPFEIMHGPFLQPKKPGQRYFLIRPESNGGVPIIVGEDSLKTRPVYEYLLQGVWTRREEVCYRVEEYSGSGVTMAPYLDQTCQVARRPVGSDHLMVEVVSVLQMRNDLNR